METTTEAITYSAQLDTIITVLNQLNTFIGVIIYVFGIVISFVIARFLYRFIIKPILRDYVKLPI